MILALRVSKRLYLESNQINIDSKATIVIANLNHANTILRTINNKASAYFPVAVIDESYENIKVNGVEVYSLDKFIELDVKCEVAIVDATIDLPSIYDKLSELNISSIKVASEYGDYGAEIKDVSVEDLLARHPKDLDKSKISEFIKDKTILITGAGGSIGSEISRQCEIFGAKKLILLDHSEYNLYMIIEELQNIEVMPVMQSVRNLSDIDDTFSKYKPEIVIHAAAYKHVPLVESNIYEGIVNNVIGTKNVIDTAIKYGVEKFVMISTDKAVRPTNVMGATKRICELYAQNSNGKGTDIVAVRFGNVLGSSGSVIPKFKAQIESGKNITVTHPDITRYFMLIPEACELVLQAGAIGTGGEIFILDMGEPIKIVDLAKKMIELSGKEEIKIEFSGLRPGEKLYEELLIDESDAKTEYES
ncbi:MAG: polysaccharide biosynthesis protein, partial [Helicobacteraceae bacterium]|nr:polysaccharide biosynthesis protein [Candidatus Sulfurimonas ponti]